MSYEDGLGLAFVAGIFLLALFATIFPERKNPSPDEMGEEQNEKNQE